MKPILLLLSLCGLLSFQAPSEDVVGEKERDAKVKEYLNTYFLQDCVKGSVFSWNKEKHETGFGYTIYQFNDFKYNVTEESVSTADKLNGIQWKGKINITYSANRTYLVGGANSMGDGYNKWSPWIGESKINIRFYKENNTWKTTGPDGGGILGALSSPDCQKIKDILK